MMFWSAENRYNIKIIEKICYWRGSCRHSRRLGNFWGFCLTIAEKTFRSFIKLYTICSGHVSDAQEIYSGGGCRCGEKDLLFYSNILQIEFEVLPRGCLRMRMANIDIPLNLVMDNRRSLSKIERVTSEKDGNFFLN